MAELPRNTFCDFGDVPLCPWCREPTDEVQVPLENLSAALQRGLGRFIERSDEGETDADIVCDCPACGKPFAVGLKAHGMLLAVRTDADRRLLAREAA